MLGRLRQHARSGRAGATGAGWAPQARADVTAVAPDPRSQACSWGHAARRPRARAGGRAGRGRAGARQARTPGPGRLSRARRRAQGKEAFSAALRLEVSQASAAARAAVEAAGGHVTTVYYNQLGLRALLKPDWFARKGRLMPRAARPPPRLAGRFDAVGLGLKQVVPAAALAGAAA